jgi:hypothetical protein
MAYDRYDSRREGRGERPRWRDDDRDFRSDRGDREERGWFERAGDEIASWFGDEDRDRGQRRGHSDRFGPDRSERSGQSGHLRNEDDIQRFYSDRDRGREFGRERDLGRRPADRAFMSDEDFGRFERSPRWRDEGYRRPYTGRSTGRPGSSDFGPERGERPYRPMTGDYGRGLEDRAENGGSFYGVGAHHDRHYGEWRARQVDELDRDYDDYARENRSRFEDDFTSWRERRQGKRQLLRQIREHMEVVGSDGEHVGTVDRTAGDRLILTKSDEASGGAHHSLMCTAIDRVEGDKVILDISADDARKQWRDDNRDRALFEREDQGEAGPGILNRSFSGTY